MPEISQIDMHNERTYVRDYCESIRRVFFVPRGYRFRCLNEELKYYATRIKLRIQN